MSLDSVNGRLHGRFDVDFLSILHTNKINHVSGKIVRQKTTVFRANRQGRDSSTFRVEWTLVRQNLPMEKLADSARSATKVIELREAYQLRVLGGKSPPYI